MCAELEQKFYFAYPFCIFSLSRFLFLFFGIWPINVCGTTVWKWPL